jgi:hypothetical protein
LTAMPHCGASSATATDSIPCSTTAARAARYDLVVSKTISPLVDRFLVVLLAFAFVKASVIVIDNAIRMKHGRDPERITFLE